MPDVSNIEDETKPDQEMFQSNQSIIEAFKSCVLAPVAKEGESRRKKRKLEVLHEDDVRFVRSQNWLELAQTDQLHTLNVLQLKLYLKSEGLPLAGKKENLIQRIKQHLMI